MRQFFMTYFGCTPNDLYHNPRTGLRTTNDGHCESCVLGPEGLLPEPTV